MKKYTFLTAYYSSFYNKELYQDVAKNWRGTGFAYLLLLLAITWIPSMYLFHRAISIWTTDVAPHIVEQMPTITIKQGVVSIDKKSPYFIKDPDSETNIAIIDTSGKYTSLDNTPASILLTKDQLLTKNANNDVNIYNLKSVKFIELTHAKVNQYLGYLKNWTALALYPICVIISFIYRILWAFIYTAIGAFIFARMMKITLEFKQLLRLSVMAMTPSIILMTLLQAMGVIFALQSWFFLMLTLGYLYFAIAANKPATDRA